MKVISLVLLLTSLILLLVFMLEGVGTSFSWLTEPSADFLEYWTAGRLNVNGGNPYSPEQVLQLQRELEASDRSRPLMMYNPPWTLALVMPFGLLPYPIGRFLWLFLQLTLIFISSIGLWRLYDGSQEQTWVAWLLGFSFAPVLFALRMGQIVPWALAGVVGFLYFERRYPDWAGAAIILITVKPQLFFLFWIALLLWIVRYRRWRVLRGLLLATGGFAMLVSLPNPDVWHQYLVTALQYPPRAWVTPTWGCILRLLFDQTYFGLQFLPMIFGVLWLLWHWQKYGGSWCWREQMPALLFISLITTAYGWSHDMLLLLVGAIQVATVVYREQYTSERFTVIAVVSYLLLESMMLAVHSLRMSEVWFIWVPVVMYLIYYGLGRMLPRRRWC